LPSELHMANPTWRTNQRRPFADSRISETGTVRSGAKANLLFHNGYPPLPDRNNRVRQELL
jgi:hypothetical protein